VNRGGDKTDRAAGGGRSAAWRKRLLVVGLALGFQVGLLSLAVFIGVMDPPLPQAAKLKLAPGSQALQREQQAAMEAQLAQLSRIQQDSLNALAEPILEAMQADLPVAALQPVQSVQAMGAMLPMGSLFQDATGALTDGLETDTLPPPDPVSFLGETLNAKRLVLLLDVSGSVKTKMERAGISMNQLRQEVHRFVDQLGPNHLFGIIQFTRKWDPFREELLPATEAVRAQAREWIDASFRTTGTGGRNWTGGQPNGIEAVLQAAFAMDPQVDEVFVVSDGDFQRTPPGGGGQDVPWPELRQFTKSLQQQSIGEARLRLLCFYPPESALSDLRAWARENGPGSVRIVESP
jgi:hypothetical protein